MSPVRHYRRACLFLTPTRHHEIDQQYVTERSTQLRIAHHPGRMLLVVFNLGLDLQRACAFAWPGRLALDHKIRFGVDREVGPLPEPRPRGLREAAARSAYARLAGSRSSAPGNQKLFSAEHGLVGQLQTGRSSDVATSCEFLVVLDVLLALCRVLMRWSGGCAIKMCPRLIRFLACGVEEERQQYLFGYASVIHRRRPSR